MQCVSMCNCALYCEQSAGIRLSEVCTVRQGVTHTVQRVQQVLHVQYAICNVQHTVFNVQGAACRRDPACQSCTRFCTQWSAKRSSAETIVGNSVHAVQCTGCTPDVSSSSSFLFFHQKITSSCPRCGETESRSESASLPSIGSFLRLSDDGKERVESDGAEESTLPVIEDVFAWKC